NYPLESFEYHKIPLMLCGPALKEEFRGTKFDKIAGNTDIPASLMAQLGMDHSKYYWSKNVFNTHYKPFAFFELDGFGFMRPEGSVVWDSKASRYYQNNASDSLSPLLVNEGKAYLQVLFGDFIKY
ncbi:MAG: sulfatase, partial [Ignavibacteria bacterium]|nr:sulfatase [Ignavibacteria bacterium]